METTVNSTSTVAMVALANLQPGKFNPRKHFDEKAISELAESISRQGVLQPIGVRKVNDALSMGNAGSELLWKQD